MSKKGRVPQMPYLNWNDAVTCQQKTELKIYYDFNFADADKKCSASL